MHSGSHTSLESASILLIKIDPGISEQPLYYIMKETFNLVPENYLFSMHPYIVIGRKTE